MKQLAFRQSVKMRVPRAVVQEFHSQAKTERVKTSEGLSPGGQGQKLALTALHVPYLLETDSGESLSALFRMVHTAS